MEKLTFLQKEERCRLFFSSLPQMYHCCTPENFEVIFRDDEDFRAATAILAISSKLSVDIKILTYQFMNNHLHIVVGGSEENVFSFFSLFKNRLNKYFCCNDRYVDLTGFTVKLHLIDNIEYLRSTISYVNRNSFVVSDDITPFSYKWGANQYIFQPLAKEYYERCRERINVLQARAFFHNKQCDIVRDLYCLDGSVSPMSFCDIESCEHAFRDARHYFQSLSKNVESYGEIAKLIGESLCYSDEDIYQIARLHAQKTNGVRNPALLPAKDKMNLANKLRFEYNASEKQIRRILKL